MKKAIVTFMLVTGIVLMSASEISTTTVVYAKPQTAYVTPTGKNIMLEAADHECRENDAGVSIRQEDELQDYCEIVSHEDLVESVPCSECGEECICTNENLLEVGTCVHCGHVNEIYQCDQEALARR